MSHGSLSSPSGCPRWLKEAGKLTVAAAAGFGLALLTNGNDKRPGEVAKPAPSTVKAEVPRVAAPVKEKGPLPASLSAAARITEAYELAQTDPDELRRRIKETKDTYERKLLLRGLFAHLANSLSPQDALKEALQFTDADQATALRELAAVWLGVSPDSIKGSRDASAVLQAGLALIYSEDLFPGTAEAWVETFKNHSARLELVSALASRLTASDPKKAMALAEGLTPWERSRFLDTVLANWAAGDPEGARRWMTDPANGSDTSGRKFPWNTASWRNPEWVASALEAERDPATRLDIIRGLAANMANKGTREAITWADSLTNPVERDAAHDRIYEVTPRGIGAVLATADGYPLVTGVLPESAAARAGLQAGDRFIEVTGSDGQPVNLYQQPLETAVNRLHGEAGESVTLRVLRNGPDGKPVEQTLRLVRNQLIFPPETAKAVK